jgi:hypothetical protein
MRSQRLPDCRPPRHDDSVTSASSHPELLIGEIVMRPRIHVPLSPSDRKVARTWTRRMLAVCVLIAAAIIGYSMINPTTTTALRNVGEKKQARAHDCEQRSPAPADAVTTTVSRSTTTRQAAPARPPARRRTGPAIAVPPAGNHSKTEGSSPAVMHATATRGKTAELCYRLAKVLRRRSASGAPKSLAF